MTEDVDLQPGRIRETPREPLYKRRATGMEPLDDDGFFSTGRTAGDPRNHR